MSFDSAAFLAERTRRIPMSTIRQVFDQVRAMEKAGQEVTRMEIGRPDFDTPAHIKAAAQEALARGEVRYAPNRGIEELWIAIADKLARDNGIHVSPDGIVVTVGCKEAIPLAFMAYLEPGDEVLMPDPSWDSYRQIVVFLGG